ncbi:RdgB/HAM1 family non-canonical purine NTP pyrophosphatase [Candidatus Woesearchaeota archaeon]|nr:RdgB/HAM1 family non-canonical purine NTP pyrophosphatase [Candidatus Woesearchaeota archaeon]
MEINFVTSNKNKVREFKEILGENAVLNHIALEYPEMRSDDPGEISRLAAKQLAEKLQKTVICEDSGMFITALKGFPGTCSKYIHQRIGLQGILKLMEKIKDRSCEYISAVGYCEPGKEPLVFIGSEQGTIAKEIKGEYGFGHDPIFIPEGSKKAYGEDAEVEKHKKFRRRAVEKLMGFLRH